MAGPPSRRAPRRRLADLRALVTGGSSGVGRAVAVALADAPVWSRGRGMPPEQAAAAILAGLERRAAEIVPGWQAKGYAFLARHLPGLIDRWAARHWRDGGTDDGRRTEAGRDE